MTAHSVVQVTAMIRSAGTRDAAIASFAALVTALHHSLGSCSAPPPDMIRMLVCRSAEATTSPVFATTAALVLPEPMSIARMYFVGMTAIGDLVLNNGLAERRWE